MFLTKNWDFHPKTNQTLSCWNLFCTSSPPINTYKTTNCVSSYCALIRHQQFRSAHRSMSRDSTELTRGRGHSVDGSHGLPQGGWGALAPSSNLKKMTSYALPKNGRFFLRRAEQVNFYRCTGFCPLWKIFCGAHDGSRFYNQWDTDESVTLIITGWRCCI